MPAPSARTSTDRLTARGWRRFRLPDGDSQTWNSQRGVLSVVEGHSAVAPSGGFGLARRPDDLPHRAHIVAGEGGHGSAELAVRKKVEQRVEKLGAVILVGADEGG